MPASSRRLFVSHRTEFVYAGTAQESVNEVRLAPISGGGQSVEHARLTVSPAADVAEWDDVFGNRVWWFQVVEPHERLVVQAETVVQTAARGTTAAVGDVGQWYVIASAGYRDRWA